MNNNKVELLSPAGNLEKLKIAINYGADAVYAGVSHFSLRIRAGKEFTFESFKEGIDYAHARGKKVYATINGFPFNSQIDLLKKHIANMAAIKPDAFIVAAPGVVKLCKEIAPDIQVDKEEYRFVNGIKLLMVQMSGTINEIKFKYYSYYYSSDKGVVQLITYSSLNLFETYKKQMEDFLNGFVEF